MKVLHWGPSVQPPAIFVERPLIRVKVFLAVN